MRLKFAAKAVHGIAARPVSFPVVLGTVRWGGVTSSVRRFIVDSGSTITLLPWSMARVLGLEATLATAPTFPIAGVGGAQVAARRAVVDIELAGQMQIRETPVYFAPGTTHIATYDGLLGQHGFFDRVRFIQRHDHAAPYFYLDL